MTATAVRGSMSVACRHGQGHAILTTFLADMEGKITILFPLPFNFVIV